MKTEGAVLNTSLAARELQIRSNDPANKVDKDLLATKTPESEFILASELNTETHEPEILSIEEAEKVAEHVVEILDSVAGKQVSFDVEGGDDPQDLRFKVVDSEGEVLREFPPTEVHRVEEILPRLEGILFDEEV